MRKQQCRMESGGAPARSAGLESGMNAGPATATVVETTRTAYFIVATAGILLMSSVCCEARQWF